MPGGAHWQRRIHHCQGSLTRAGWLHSFGSHANRHMLTQPARGQVRRDWLVAHGLKDSDASKSLQVAI